MFRQTTGTPEMVRLKNGSDAPKALVTRITTTMCQLFNHCHDPLTVVNLYEVCKNPAALTTLLPFSKQQLQGFGFLVDDRVPLDIRNIVLSSIEEDASKHGFEKYKVTDPVNREDELTTRPGFGG